jgi:hypothetical protein
MVVNQGLNKRYVGLSLLLEAELSAVRLDPSQSISTLGQDLDGVLVEYNPRNQKVRDPYTKCTKVRNPRNTRAFAHRWWVINSDCATGLQ